MKRLRIDIDRLVADAGAGDGRGAPAVVERAVRDALAKHGIDGVPAATVRDKTSQAIDAAVRGGKR
jgi:hypothetical protein